MPAVKSSAAAASLAILRARARAAQTLIASFVIAVAIGALLVLSALPDVGRELVLRHTVETLRPQDRAVTVVVAPDHLLDRDEIGRIDTRLRRRFADLPLAPLRSLVEFRSLATTAGTVFRLGGLQNLADAVDLQEGRLPKSCSPTRCEVVAIGPPNERLGPEPAPGLVVVGRAVQVDPVPFTGDLALSEGEQLILADGVEDVNAFASLLLIRRSLAWVTPLDPQRITRANIGPLLQSLADAGSDIDLAGYSVTAPDDELSDALQRAAVAGRSLALPQAQGTLLLVVALVIVALVLRGSHQVAADRLARRGASPTAVAAFDLVSTGVIVALGIAVGTLLGALAIVWLSSHFDLLWSTNLRSAFSLPRLGVFVGLGLLMWFVMTAVVRARESRTTVMRRGLRVSDLTALLSAAALAVLVQRGDTNAAELSQRSDPLLWAMPVLVAVLIVSISQRIVPILIMAAARLVPTARLLDRIAIVDGARRSVRTVATAAMVATAAAFATFTLGYRSTLLNAAEERAAFAVPFDARLTVGSDLVHPPKLRPKGGWSELVPGTVSTDVLRRSAELRRSGTVVDTVEVVGLDPSKLGLLRSTRRDYGPAAPDIIRALTVVPPEPIGALIPADADALQFDIDGPSELTKLAAVIERVDGSWHETAATPDSPGRPAVALEPGDAGGRFIGLRVAQIDETASRIEHHVQEGNTSVEAFDVGFVLHSVNAMTGGARSTALEFDARSWEDEAGEVRAQPDGSVAIQASILGSSRLIVPKPDDPAMPALTDPLTASAAVDGIVTIETQGREFRFRVVGTAERFPTMGDRFVLTDLGVLRRGLDLAQPGYGAPIETWLAADSPPHEAQRAAALSLPPYSTVDVDRRVDRLREEQRDPLSRLSLSVLTWSTLLATAMVFGSLLLHSAAERTDDEAFHRFLALDGAPPSTITRLVTIRTASLAFAALPIGIAAGALMTPLVASAIRITADAVPPNPPLRLIIPWGALLVALALFVILVGTASATGARVGRRLPRSSWLREAP